MMTQINNDNINDTKKVNSMKDVDLEDALDIVGDLCMSRMTQINNDNMSDRKNVNSMKDVDLEDALDIVGIGWYNISYSLVIVWCLMAYVGECFSYAYLLPAAKCDLNLSEYERGIISSLPYIGSAIGGLPLGYLLDTRGRKPVLLISSSLAGLFGVIASFMPNTISFTLFKLLGSLCLVGAASSPHVFVSEIVPKSYRDLALSITSASQFTACAVLHLIAWGVLTMDFNIDLGLYNYRPWRLFSMICSCSLLISALLLTCGYESPKFLVSKGRHYEAMHVLRQMYSVNKLKSAKYYPVLSIKDSPEKTSKSPSGFIESIKAQSIPILKPPYIKWLMLVSVLMFGIYSCISGIYIWIPYIVNRVFSSTTSNTLTVCQIIHEGLNETVAVGGNASSLICDDSIQEKTFSTNAISIGICVLIILTLSTSVKVLGKKPLLVGLYIAIGGLCILVANVVTNDILITMCLTFSQVLSVGIGLVCGYVVCIFPTHLRGMAVSITLLVGRVGAIIGINFVGLLIDNACESTFYTFGGFLWLCALLSFLLP